MPENYKEGLVSVILPTYNLEKYIKDTVESVLQQSYSPIEIVLVDDCSTDRTAEIVTSLKGQNDCIRFIRLRENSGAAVARNTAIQNASGQYVAFLDGDDLWEPQKIEKQINLLNKKKGAFCYTAIEIMDEDGNVIKGKRKIVPEVDYKFLLRNTIIATSTVLLDRKIIGDFEMPSRRSGQDYATWLMILRNDVIAYGIDEPLVKYRSGRINSLSSSKTKNYKKVWHIQVENEGISKLSATFNTICYIGNAVRKYYF